VRALGAVVVAVVAATGCGGAAKPAATSSPTPTQQSATAPEPLERCAAAGRGWKALATSGYYKPPAARLGDGRLGVVFANDSDNETCSWSSEARALAAKGYEVAVF
jgi:hypothetical protein